MMILFQALKKPFPEPQQIGEASISIGTFHYQLFAQNRKEIKVKREGRKYEVKKKKPNLHKEKEGHTELNGFFKLS